MIDDLAEKDYNSFMVNRGLSYYNDTVIYANEMNIHNQIDSRMQYDFLRNIIRKRQLEGIARAKEKGVYQGRKAKIDIERIKVLKKEGLGATAIARKLNIHRDSVYRLLKKVEA